MDNTNFSKLIEEIKRNNYVELKDGNLLLSHKNIEKLRKKGFSINEKIIDEILDYFNDDFNYKILLKEDEKLDKKIDKTLTAKEINSIYDNMSLGGKIITTTMILVVIVVGILILKFLYPSGSEPKHFEQMYGTEDPYWAP
jgi:hypothetical protein